MGKCWSFLMACLLVFTLTTLQAPRPCIGDGQGGACRPEACACIAACTCQAAHAAQAAEAAPSSCCAGKAASSCETPVEPAASCHTPGGETHFAPPHRDWAGLPAAPPKALHLPPRQLELAVRRPDWPAKRALAPPEKPPRAVA